MSIKRIVNNLKGGKTSKAVSSKTAIKKVAISEVKKRKERKESKAGMQKKAGKKYKQQFHTTIASSDNDKLRRIKDLANEIKSVRGGTLDDVFLEAIQDYAEKNGVI